MRGYLRKLLILQNGLLLSTQNSPYNAVFPASVLGFKSAAPIKPAPARAIDVNLSGSASVTSDGAAFAICSLFLPMICDKSE